FGWDAKEHRWFEWGVGLDEGKLGWSRLPGSPTLSSTLCRSTLSPGASTVPRQSEEDKVRKTKWGETVSIPDGFILERSPAAEEWWHSAAKALELGKLVTIDYGFD